MIDKVGIVSCYGWGSGNNGVYCNGYLWNFYSYVCFYWRSVVSVVVKVGMKNDSFVKYIMMFLW